MAASRMANLKPNEQAVNKAPGPERPGEQPVTIDTAAKAYPTAWG
jgi:hypothetical protein